MTEPPKKKPTNLRQQRRDSEKSYLYLVVFTLVVIGGGLIALIYGPEALLTAVPCLVGGSLIILIPWFLLTALEKWRDRM